MLVLGFDTSAAHCAAALVSAEGVLAQREEAMAVGQAERLRPLAEELLAEAGAVWRDLGGLGVGTGPGNFTGVRIAVAFARGLALGLGVPAVGVTAFEALARGRESCLAARDARAGRVHLQAFGRPAFGPVTLGLDDPLPAPLPPGTPVVGDLAAALAARHGGVAAPPLWPLAVAIAQGARDRLAAAPPPARPAPLYLRPPDAAPPREPAPAVRPG